MSPSRRTPKKPSPPKAGRAQLRDDSDIDSDLGEGEPEQTEEERRMVRSDIYSMHERIKHLKNGEASKDILAGIIKEVDDIVPRLKGPQEACEDAKMFADLCTYVREVSEDANGNEKKFLPSEFVMMLAQKFEATGGSADSRKFTKTGLVEMGRNTSKHFIRAPTLKFVLGALHTEAGEQKPERRKAVRVRNKIAAATKTTLVDKNQPTGSETEKLVKKTLRCLENECKKRKITKMCYFTFVIDPESFGNTVENMFHVSFLVKHHQAILAIDERGLPVLEGAKRARHKTDDEEEEEDSSRSQQAVMSFSWDDWMELKTNLHITKKCIELED